MGGMGEGRGEVEGRWGGRRKGDGKDREVNKNIKVGM